MNQPSNPIANADRRDFLKVSLGLALSSTGSISMMSLASAEASGTLNAYVNINADGSVTIYGPNPEVGQGVNTSLPMIVAEELDANWEDVQCEPAPVQQQYGMQFAGGSLSIPMRWDEMRKMGATAREMLCRAAASHGMCHAMSSRQLTRWFGMALRASRLTTKIWWRQRHS